MTVLIVDDESHVVRSLQKNIDWSLLNIDQVYTAVSVRQAKEVIQNFQIDILLSDIEMPQSSGLDLLEWIRNNNYDIEAAFLTSYDYFNYAQRAILLKSARYYLKPINYPELFDGLRELVSRVLLKQENAEHKKHSENWKRSKQDVVSYFWERLLTGKFENNDSVFSHLNSDTIPYQNESRFVPMMIRIPDYFSNALITEQLIQSTLSEKVSGMSCEYVTALNRDDCVLIFLLHPEMTGITSEAVNHIQRLLQNTINRDFLFGIGLECYCYEVYSITLSIKDMLDENMQGSPFALLLKNYEYSASDRDFSAIRSLRSYMDYDDFSLYIRAVMDFLNTMTYSGHISTKMLNYLRMDVLQAYGNTVKNMEIPAHEIMSDEEITGLLENACRSVADMKKLLEMMIQRVAPDEAAKERTAIQIVQDYVDIHYSEHIKRSELAKKVYFSADYLSHCFKEKTGLSLGNYIIMKRMTYAKKMLQETDKPINLISSSVGYDNFAYFSKVFRRFYGVSPLKYRKKFRSHSDP